MKKNLLLIAAFVAPIAMTAMSTVPVTSAVDTVKVIDNARKVVITENKSNTTIDVLGTAADSTFHYTYTSRVLPDAHATTEQKEHISRGQVIHNPFKRNADEQSDEKKSHWSCIASGLYFGYGWANHNKTSVEFKDALKGNFEWGVLNLIGVAYHNRSSRFSLGFGLEWRHYYVKNHTLIKDDNGVIHLDNFPETSKANKAGIRAFSLQFPLIYRCRLPKNWAIWAGGVMNINTGLNLHTEYKIGDAEYDFTIRNLKRRVVTFDAIGGVAWKGIGAYIRFRPQSIIKDGFGPKFNVVSAGLMLAM